jgi:hypothetical protein
MWETLTRAPLGNITLRKFIVLFSTAIVACFAYILATPVNALAEDAFFESGDSITYKDESYKKFGYTKSSDDMFGSKIPNGSIMFINLSADTDLVRVIFLKNVTEDNYTSAKEGSYITFKDTNTAVTTDKLQDPSAVTSISIAPRAPPSDIESGTSSCKIEGGLGWIICPITRTLASGMDFIYSMVMQYLEVAPLSTTTDKALYRAWGQIRNIANVLFIIGFLVLVYSQITGGLMSNYTIKKMLPRIIIAAILVNISYWICALAVDLSNVIGFSVGNLFDIVRNNLVGEESNNWNLVTWDSMATFILTGGTVATGAGITYLLSVSAITTASAGSGLIFLFLPMLITVFFIVLVTFLILAARQAIIVILIVLAPIAFVAYLLPNTEEWFHKWRKGLIVLLILFPAFSVVFYGAQLAAAIIIQNANGANGINMVLLAMGVQLAPLAITPLLLKLGGGILNRFANIVNNPAKGVFDRGKNWANERRNQSLARGNAVLASRANRGVLDPTRRFNPSSMAYRRNNNRLAREGEKSANESLNTAYFTQTANGRRIAMMNQRAKLEQGLGDNQNQAQWNNAVRTNPVLNNRAHQSHEAHKRADLYQRAVDAQGDEHWAHAQQHDPGLLAVRRNAHLSEGRAKLTEESLTNADERVLQTQIARTPGLRNMKVQADVDTAHANFQAANVTAQGKARFQGEVVASGALRNLNNQTVSFEKEAGSIENRLKSDAEANWERTSKTDVRLQNIRLSEVKASDQHKQAEAQWNNLVENIRLNGGNAAGLRGANRGLGVDIGRLTRDVATEEMTTKALQSVISSRNEQEFTRSTAGRQLNIRNQAAKDLLDSAKAEEAAIIQEWRTEKGAKDANGNPLTGVDAQLARQLNEADTQKRAETQRTAVASGVADQEYAGLVRDDSIIPGGTQSVAEVAGGIAGDAGISQAKARATQTIFKAFDESVSAEKTLVSRNTPADVLKADIPDPSDPNGPTSVGLGSPNILDEPEERIAALAGKVASGRHQESQIKLWQRMGELGRQANQELTDARASGNPAAITRAEERVGKVKSLEQQVYGDKSKVPFGAGDRDLGQAEVGQYSGNIYESTRARIDTHMSAATLASMDPDDIRLIFEMARDNKLPQDKLEKVRKAYDDWQLDDNLKASLQDKHRTLLEPIKQHAETGTPDYLTSSDFPQGSEEAYFWSDKYRSGLDSLS